MKRALAWIWLGVIVAATVAIVVRAPEGVPADPSPILFTALGAIIATRRPGNRVAWILLLIGVGVLIEPAAIIRFADGPPESMTVWDVLLLNGLNTSFFTVFILPIGLLLFIFPTGTFLTRRWRWAGWLTGISMAGFLSGIFSDVIVLTTPDASWSIVNPIGFIPESANPILDYVYGLPMLTVLIGGVFAIVIRYRRSDDVVRAQIKWVALSLILFVVAIFSRFATYEQGSVVSEALLAASTSFIPISMTLAILRYRLYDIDRIISRTFGYLIVVAVLGLVYGVGAVWIPTAILGDRSPVFVAASTLAAASLFNPVRRRVLAWVDRRFNRSKYDGERVLEEFASSLRDVTDIRVLSRDSLEVVRRTMQPQSAGIWVRE